MPALQSSVVHEADYDARARRLLIRFPSGERYAYEGVPREVYEALLAAPSHGQYFGQHIRDHYPYRRIR